MSGLLILGTDGLLHLARVEHDRVEVEVFARPRIGREILSPVWGPDGSWVAWSESDGVDGRIRVMGVDGDVVFEQSGFPAFCLDPSPDGSRLAQLASGPLGLELGVLEVPGGGSTLVARGAPLYWCWAPSGKRLAVHVEERVVVADLAVLAGAVVEHELVHRSDRFLSPWWSPGGQELMLVDDQQRLVAMSVQDDVVVSLAEGQLGYRFAVAPDGRRIAVVTQRGDAAVEVVDRLTGERVVAVDEPVAGMWWSPDGSKLATLVRAAGDDRPLVRWKVWDGRGNEFSSAFRPSKVIAEAVLPFFEQFAFAHRFWSPAGDALVTPRVLDSGRSEICVERLDGGPPQPVADGVMGWWQPEPSAGPADS